MLKMRMKDKYNITNPDTGHGIHATGYSSRSTNVFWKDKEKLVFLPKHFHCYDKASISVGD